MDDSTLGRLPGMTEVLVATMGHSTRCAAVDAVLEALFAGVRDALGPQLVGVYLDGSLAAGDFAECSSDIDVMVVTEGVLPDEVVAALGAMHARLATGTSKWSRELEVSYIHAVRFAASIPTTIAIPVSSVAAVSSPSRRTTATG